jgi:tRNA dimethylallyltransferase
MGPTATGKTQLAIALSKLLPLDIISVDSSMVYRGMDIGTAKPSPAELKTTPHYLIDICDPKEPYSAGRFREDALKAIEKITTQKKIPLLVGGTMLYFRALQQGLSNLPRANSSVRAKISAEAAKHGQHFLHTKLKSIDPIAAARIQPNDVQRLQRALELCILTGKTVTELYAENKTEALPFTSINLGITIPNKNLLQQRIELRLQNMLQQGFLQEVEKLMQRGDLNPDLPAMRAVGYRQAWCYLKNEIDYIPNENRFSWLAPIDPSSLEFPLGGEEKATGVYKDIHDCCERRSQQRGKIKCDGYTTMVNAIIIATRQLAKRQMTWLRSWPQLLWFANETPEDNSLLLEKIYAYLVKELKV